MKKWTMLLALLLATVFCGPGALAEQGSRGIHRG